MLQDLRGKCLPFTKSISAASLAYYTSVIVLFVIVHATTDKLGAILETVEQGKKSGTIVNWISMARLYAPAIKALFFLIALGIVGKPILEDVRRILHRDAVKTIALPILAALGIAILMAIFAYRPGNYSMGLQYANISSNPFGQNAGWYNTRILLPAIAYLLLLHGYWPYYSLFIFLTLCFIALVYAWTTSRVGLRAWEVASLCTSSFVIYQFQSGGYPDILVFLCFLLVMCEFTGQESKLSLLILAILAHESSVFIGIVLAWRYLDRRRLIGFVTAVCFYGVVWFSFTGYDIRALLSSHEVHEKSTLEWIIDKPWNEIAGIIVSFKAVWIAYFVGLWIAFQKRYYKDMIFMLTCIISGLFMTFLGVDTSRLIGFAFPGAFIALSTVASNLPAHKATRLLSWIFIANLLLPSFYIGLNTGVFFVPGVYKYLYSWITVQF